MKRRIWIGAACAALACVMGYWVFRSWSSDDYLHALPSRPKALMAVDWLRLADDSGLGRDGLAAWFPERGTLPQGIDWKKRSYLFVSGKEYVGLLVPVEDKEKLAGWFQKIAGSGKCTMPEERNGRYWTVWDGSWMAGFDDRALLLIGPGLKANMDALRQEVMACLRQKKEESGMVSSVFADVEKSASACLLVAQLDVLPAFYGENFKSGLPDHASLSDVNVVAELQFSERGLTLDAEIRSENPRINQYYERFALLGGKIDGDYAACVPAEAMGWCCVNVDGDKLLEQLRTHPAVRTFLLGLNMGVDADLMIKSIRGDLALTCYPSAFSGTDFLLKARLENTDFLKEVAYWKESAARSGALTFRDFGGNRFFIGTESVQVYFGVAGRTFYVTPDKGLAAHADGPETSTLAEWEKEIKGSRFFLWFNLAQLHNVPGWPGGSDLFGSLVLRSSDARHFTLDVRGEKGRNVWKDLLK